MNTLVRFWGTRGSIPTPGNLTRRYGGNTSCVSIRVGSALFICDGGTGLRELGVSLEDELAGEPMEAHLFFSHTHWDHIQGFPFFVPAYSERNTMYVYDATREDDRVRQLLLGQMSSDYFPVTFRDLGSRITSRNLEAGKTILEGVTICHREQVHPGKSFAYSFEANGKKVVYATDSELDLSIQNPDASERDPNVLRELPTELIRFIADADLLIADGQYTDAEYPEKRGWGHARANTVVDLAVQAGVKQCAIFHHDPMHSDDHVEQIVAEGRQRAEAHDSPVQIFAAREGIELSV